MAPWPPLIPVGAVKVTFKVNEPLNNCVGAVLKKNEPKLLLPLREPRFNAVVPVKAELPANVNCGTPVTDPVVDPAIVVQIRQGRNFPVSPFRMSAGSKYVKAVSREGDLVAVGEARLPNLYHPIVVL